MSVPENFGTLLSKQDHLVLHLISIGQLETSYTARSKEEKLRFPHFLSFVCVYCFFFGLFAVVFFCFFFVFFLFFVCFSGNVRCFDALMSKQPALKTFSLNNGDVTS